MMPMGPVLRIHLIRSSHGNPASSSGFDHGSGGVFFYVLSVKLFVGTS